MDPVRQVLFDDMKVIEWLLPRLQEERANFANETTTPRSSHYLRRLRGWQRILEEDNEEVHQLSSGAQSHRNRALFCLKDIHDIFGPELVVLFMYAVSMTKLARVKLDPILPSLTQWWSDVSHPRALTKFVKTEEVQNLVALVTLQGDLKVTRTATPQTPADVTVLLKPVGPELHLKLDDLLRFIQLRNVGNIDLKMKCNYLGSPLPYIEINEGDSVGLSGKLDFSIQLGEALLKFMLPSRAAGAAEISDSRRAE